MRYQDKIQEALCTANERRTKVPYLSDVRQKAELTRESQDAHTFTIKYLCELSYLSVIIQVPSQGIRRSYEQDVCHSSNQMSNPCASGSSLPCSSEQYRIRVQSDYASRTAGTTPHEDTCSTCVVSECFQISQELSSFRKQNRFHADAVTTERILDIAFPVPRP